MAGHSSATFNYESDNMKKTLINSWAYNYHTKFTIEHAVDSAESVESAILDKLGKKDIVWENLGQSYHSGLNRITYEEVIDDTRPIQSKKVLGVEVGTRAY